VTNRARSDKFYFTTRDLLMMAALAALGGVTSTYVNAFGDLVQSVLHMPGATQWAAGLHVLWIALAMGLVSKPGTGTLTGILKGVVELLSGNTHGVLVLLIDVIAGLLVDLGVLAFKRKDGWPAFTLAGGLAAASNVMVFQLFAGLPMNTLTAGALALISGVAFLSGVVFAGILGWMLLNALRRAGVVRDRGPVTASPSATRIAVVAAVVLAGALFAYLRLSLRGPETVRVEGAVASPYAYPEEHADIEAISVETTLRDVTSQYAGIPLRELVARADPEPTAAMVLITATDGYAFFVTLEEMQANEDIVLTVQGRGKDTAYNVVGPESSKAWVRNVAHLTVVGAAPLEITGGSSAPSLFQPADWQSEMDAATVSLAGGARKLQGVPLRLVLAAMDVTADTASLDLVVEGGDTVNLPMAQITDDDVRIFTKIDPAGVTYAVAHATGQVIAAPVTSIKVR